MIRRFCKGMFTDEYKKTIGVDFLEKALYVDALGEEVRFMLWDTGGSNACVLGVGQHASKHAWCVHGSWCVLAAVSAARAGRTVLTSVHTCMLAAGQEEFDAITRGYYRGAGAAVIAFSTTDRASFDAVSMWKSKVENECGDIAMAMVQNKVCGGHDGIGVSCVYDAQLS